MIRRIVILTGVNRLLLDSLVGEICAHKLSSNQQITPVEVHYASYEKQYSYTLYIGQHI